MSYAIEIGPWLVGPFPTHIAAQYWAESHGVDDWCLREMDDPAEAPGKLAKMRRWWHEKARRHAPPGSSLSTGSD